MLPGRAERGVSWSNTSRCNGNLSGDSEKNRGEKKSFGITEKSKITKSFVVKMVRPKGFFTECEG